MIDGKCTTLTGLSDFVVNLEASGYFKKSIEIVDSKPEASRTPPGELVKFSIKARSSSRARRRPAAAAAKVGG